jgi:hypothetical protein
MQGRELRVTSRSRNPELPVTVVDENGTGLRLPAWMVAPEAAHYQLAEQATLDVQTLRALAALLIPLLDDGLAGEENRSNPCMRREGRLCHDIENKSPLGRSTLGRHR